MATPEDDPMVQALAKAWAEEMFGPGVAPSGTAIHNARSFVCMWRALERFSETNAIPFVATSTAAARALDLAAREIGEIPA